MKFLYTGDWHLRGNNPRNRIDDYMTAADNKLREIFSLAEKHKVNAILVPGDIWDRPEVSISVLLHYADLINEYATCKIFTAIGNHDIYGYNLSTYNRSSLHLLTLLCPNFIVWTDATVGAFYPDSQILISCTPYSRNMDIDGYGYVYEYTGDDRSYEKNCTATHIHIAHGMLLDHVPPFDRYTLINDCHTNADIVLNGHDHTGYGVIKRADGKLFCNPGAVMRMSASVREIERPVQVALITVDGDDRNIQLIPLTTALPGDEVLDRSKIDEAKARQYAMDNFSTLIQSHTGQKVITDINQIVDTIASQENYAPEVVKTALEILDRQKEALQGGIAL